MRPGRITITQVARRLGCSRWTARRRMWQWHEEHGGLLERVRGDGTTLYVVMSRLRELEEWDRAETSRRRIAALETRVDRVEALTERTWQKVERLSRA